jgi:SAM-dependent methyltransferase
MTEWSADPALWEAMEPALCAPARLAQAQGDVRAIEACVELALPARVLDLACGPGAHAVAFAQRGHRVTGVDASGRLLARARAAAVRERMRVEWVQADMREFRRPGSFDLVCSLYASFGYFEDRANRRVLERIGASLAPGGSVVLDVLGREAIARRLPAHREHEVDGTRYVEQSALSGDSSWLVSDWTVVQGGVRQEFRVRQRVYSGPELRDLLLSVGFTSVRIAGGLDGETAYDEAAPRLVAVARQPAVAATGAV